MLFVTRQLGENGWVIIQDKCVATTGSGRVCGGGGGGARALGRVPVRQQCTSV